MTAPSLPRAVPGVAEGVGTSAARPDGPAKVAGEFAFSSDLWHADMLWGATTRSPHPRARRSRAMAGQADWEHRVEMLEARIEHLEAALEGLQDAVYRQAQLTEDKHDELRARIEPERMAIDLAQDALRRGL